MSRVGIIAALPGELKPLVQGWKPCLCPVRAKARRHGLPAWTMWIASRSAAALAARLRRTPATIAAQGGALDAVVSVGWAGALSCGIHPGNAYAVNEVIDARTGEHFATNFPLPEGSGVPLRLVTTDHIVQYAEKRQLAGLYQAVMVDMEAVTVARFARSQNIPFYCLKAISDEIADILPDFGRYTDSDGHLRVAPLLGHVAVRPKYWPAMLRIGQNAKSGARAVAGALGPLIGNA